MSIFDNGYTGEEASDAMAALYDPAPEEQGEVAEQGGEAEENTSEQPQQTADEQQEDTAPAQQAQQEDPAAADPAPGQQAQQEMIEAHRYHSLQTAYQREKEAHKQALAQLEELRNTVSASQGKDLTAEEQEAFADLLLRNPAAAFAQYMGNQIKTEAAKQVNEIIQPLQQQMKVQKAATVMREAEEELMKSYPQLNDAAERTKLVEGIRAISESVGGVDAWLNDPKVYMQMAAIRLYGLPKQLDQATLDKAVNQAKADALKELQERDAGKAGKDATQKNVPEPEKTVEDEIFDAIANIHSGGIFG